MFQGNWRMKNMHTSPWHWSQKAKFISPAFTVFWFYNCSLLNQLLTDRDCSPVSVNSCRSEEKVQDSGSCGLPLHFFSKCICSFCALTSVCSSVSSFSRAPLSHPSGVLPRTVSFACSVWRVCFSPSFPIQLLVLWDPLVSSPSSLPLLLELSRGLSQQFDRFASTA